MRAERTGPAGEEAVRPPHFGSPRELRRAARAGRFHGQTSGLCPGALQVNLAILPADLADAFLRFCVRNPKPCPVIGVGEPGATGIAGLGEDLDVSRDTPSYRVWRDGRIAETLPDVSHLWRDDLVAFALGCSFSFEDALVRAGIPVRHVEAGRNVPMYVEPSRRRPSAGRWSSPCAPSGRPTRSGQSRCPSGIRGRTARLSTSETPLPSASATCVRPISETRR